MFAKHKTGTNDGEQEEEHFWAASSIFCPILETAVASEMKNSPILMAVNRSVLCCCQLIESTTIQMWNHLYVYQSQSKILYLMVNSVSLENYIFVSCCLIVKQMSVIIFIHVKNKCIIQ